MRSVPIVVGKDPGHVPAELVDGGHDDVARRFVVELLDAFAQIGLHDLDAAGLEKRPHLALVGEHRLRLDQRARPARTQDVEHDLVVLGGVHRPVHMRAVLYRIALELLQIVGEMGERVFLDRRRERAQLLPLGQVLALAVALLAQVPQPPVVKLEVVLGLDELRGRFGVVDALHRHRLPLIACSIEDLRDMDELERQSEPFRAALLMHQARHVAGHDVFRAGLLVIVHLVVSHLRGDGLLEHRECPAESAALVGPLRRDEPDAFHLGKQVERLREERPSISDIFAVPQGTQRRASVVQPHGMRELGPRKFAHLEHVVHEFDELERAAAGLERLRGLRDRRQVVPYVVHAAAGRRDDVVEAREVPHEQRSVAAASSWQPLFAIGCPQQVWSSG